MNCKNCGKEIDDNIEKCPFCGTNLIETEKSSDNTDSISAETSQDMFDKIIEENASKGGFSIPPFIFVLIGIFVVDVVLGLIYMGMENSRIKKTAQEQQIVNNKLKELGQVYRTIYVLKRPVELYCKEAGYIPTEYLNLLDSTFGETRNKVIEEITVIYDRPKESMLLELDNKLEEALRPEINAYEQDYKSIQQQYPQFTRKDYCKIYDSEKNSIINEKIKIFNELNPKWALNK